MELHTPPFEIPARISRVVSAIKDAGYEAWLVGGCVRDLIMGRTPNDWDITTNATPEQILDVFNTEYVLNHFKDIEVKVLYENDFGTVSFIYEEEPLDSNQRTIEITPYRIDGSYSDSRRPDSVSYGTSLHEDLARRDFTVNAMAYDPISHVLEDPYKGQTDIREGILKTVGEADVRYGEDALRMLRMVRFAAQLGFTCSVDTFAAAARGADTIQNISWERIRDEFTKIIMSVDPKRGIELAHDAGLLKHILPELEEGIGCDQSRNHIYDVWTHDLNAGQNAAAQGWPLHVRLASLFHDIGKPRTRRWDKEKNLYTFYGHEVVGARMVKAIMARLKFPKKLSETVTKLVRYHMFFSDTEKITLSAVRRMIRNVGRDHIWDLMNVRRSDRIGMGRPKAAPYRLRMYESMIEEALRDPISVGMLKLNGDQMINDLGFTPGRRMGWILHALLEEVIDDPKRNTYEALSARAQELNVLEDTSLRELGEQGRERQDELEEAAVARLRKKHRVQTKPKNI